MNRKGAFSTDTDMDDIIKWLLRIIFFIILAGGLFYLTKAVLGWG